MTTPIYIVDLFQDIVTSMTPTLLPTIQANESAALAIDPEATIKQSMIKTIHYDYGHVKELITKLSNLDKSDQLRFTKYPLVYLVQDFPEDRGDRPGIYADIIVSIVICHQTKDTAVIQDRMKNVFKPVLYPIYYALMSAIAVYPLFNVSDEGLIKHRKIDRAYWGKTSIGGNDANTLNDFVDAIDITNIKIPVLYNC